MLPSSAATLFDVAGGTPFTLRGFTDHEHIDQAQLIHMNGRVYDYNLGRFLSIDPLIQAPGNSQSLNPYSYIMNNPLAGTDPSGYMSVDCFLSVSCEGEAPDNPFDYPSDCPFCVSAGDGAQSNGAMNDSTFNDVEAEEVGAPGEVHNNIGHRFAPEITGTIEPIVGSPIKGFLKSLVNGLTFGIVYGDISSINSLNADPTDSADIEAYKAQAGPEKYAMMALPANVPKNIIKLINPKTLISRQGRSEMTGSKLKRMHKSMRSDGFDESQPIDVADVNGKMIIIDGHHRAAAASAEQLKQVPVRVNQVSQKEADQLLIEAAEARY